MAVGVIKKKAFQIRVHKIDKDGVIKCGLFISAKAKKILGKSQAQFQETLGKLRRRKNDGFLIKNVYCIWSSGCLENRLLRREGWHCCLLTDTLASL